MSTETNHPEPDLSEFADLAVALEAARPEPTEEFTERLDAAVADHFPAEWSNESWGDSRDGFLTPIKRWLRQLNRHRLPLMAGGAGLAVVVIAVGIGLNQGPDEPGPDTPTTIADSNSGRAAEGELFDGSGKATEDSAGATAGPARIESESLAQADAGGHFSRVRPTSKAPGPYAAGIANRKVAQEAEITLGTRPENVQEVSNEIVETVDDHNGIVLDSSVKDGPAGEAGADFSLMIPSAQLESAISDLSGIADLRARSQETEDITAPTLTVQDSLRTARARVESLVGQLADATTDEERAKVEDELGQERRKVARLTTRLNRLDRKANLTPVAVTVETGGGASADQNDSSWGITDAVDEAGRMLAIAAGVALIALAVAIPVALLVLIALALNRAWVRRARRRALDES
ncbi:MAG TPA: DUF4349 domain-containing protein [Solirubrobacterales bacterium]|nr:DUF4349 domain-containing protein [Solirubrobacterales bacterium]